MKHVLAISALALLASVAAAQTTSSIAPVPVGAPTFLGTYDLETETWIGTPPPTGLVVYDNTTLNNSYFPSGPGLINMDWGTLSAGGRNAITSVQIGYATIAAGPVDIAFALHEGATGFGDPGTTITQFLIQGLPGSVSGAAEAFAFDVAIPKTNLDDGPIGWSYELFDLDTGPLTIGPPNGAGVVDAFDQYDSGLAYIGTFFFGGAPFASFYCQLTGETPAECFLVIGDGPGNDTYLPGEFMFETQISDIGQSWEVLMNDYPTFTLPNQLLAPAQGGMVGGNGQTATNGRLPEFMNADGSFAVQVMMWNPWEVPANPEQYSKGLMVQLQPDGTLTARPFGEGEIAIQLDTGVDADGNTTFSFPFAVNF